MEVVVIVAAVAAAVLASMTGPGLGRKLSVVRIVERLRGNGRVVGRVEDAGGGEDLLWLLVSRVHVQVVIVLVLGRGAVVHERRWVGVVKVQEARVLK